MGPRGRGEPLSITSVAVAQTAPSLLADASMRNIASEIEKRHDESVERLQEWVKHPALAAEDRGMDEGCDLMMRLARDAEGEEEIGSPHFRQVVAHPDVRAALKRTVGVFMPSAFQDPDGSVSIFLGAKG